MMNEQDYLQQRLDDQIDWYDEKSSWNQHMYKYLRMAEISCAAIIPFLVGFISDINSAGIYLKILVGALGAAIAILTGIQSLFRFQEHWVQYRSTAEALKREKIFFQTKVGAYGDDKAFVLLVQQVESILSAEQGGWVQYTSTKESTPTQS